MNEGAGPIHPTAVGAIGRTAVPGLWVPVVVFAHLFAGFWLLKTWLLNSPSLRRKAAAPARAAKSASKRLVESLHKASGGVAAAARRGASDDAGGGTGGDQVDVEVQVPPGFDAESPDAEAGDSAAEQLPEEVLTALKTPDCTGLQRQLPGHQQQQHSIVVAPIGLEWQGIGCSYTTPSGPKEVLADIWGSAQPGEMQALLGPSGAGKSTFMDILALRKSVGNLTGRLLVNGQRATKRFVRMTSYVPQEDNFVPTMTTWEVMSFYADIILPSSWSPQRRRVRIKEVLAEVGLAHAHATIVGGTLPGGLMMRGLSGGERRRLAIAVGILAAPSVLFLDEPTSGLDSFAALTVMGYLKRMVLAQGQVVIASIHQPRSAIWQMFDAVTLLASGRLMFQGLREGMTPWFGSLGYLYDPGLHGVPSDWALDLVAIGFAKPARFYGCTISSKEELMAASAAFKAHYLLRCGLSGDELCSPRRGDRSPRKALPRQGSAAAALSARAQAAAPAAGDFGPQAEVPLRLVNSVGDLQAFEGGACSGGGVSHHSGGGSRDSGGGGGISIGGAGPASSAAGKLPAKFETGVLRQIRTLLGRELLSITRNPFDVAGRTLTFAWVGLLMGVLNYAMPFTAGSVRNRLNLLFTVLCFYCLMPYISMGLYTADKKFYLSDATSQLYRPAAYYVAKVAAITPFQIVSACVYGLTVYGMAGMRHGGAAVFKNGLVNTLMYLIASQVLHCCAVIAPNQDVAFMLSILWTAIQLLLSGFFVNLNDVYNEWITGLRFVSATYYSFEALSINEFDGTYLTCDETMGPVEFNLLKEAFPNANNSQRNQVSGFLKTPGPNCVFDTKAILTYFKFGRPFWMSCTILLGYLGLIHILTFCAMLVAARRERR